jgi:hypothetical protein
MHSPGKVIIEGATDSGSEYTIIHTIKMAPTGDQCPKCGYMLWTHSDNPSMLYTFGFVFEGSPILVPHYSPCAKGWD